MSDTPRSLRSNHAESLRSNRAERRRVPKWKLGSIFLAIAMMMSGAAATLVPEIVKDRIDNAVPIGSGIAYVAFLKIYKATLYAPDNHWQRDQPFAMSLECLFPSTGKKMAKHMIKQIRRLGFDDQARLAHWHEALEAILPAKIRHGDVLTGFSQPFEPTRFYKDQQEIGMIDDPEFGWWFFGIWLDENTKEPKLRRQLLGKNHRES